METVFIVLFIYIISVFFNRLLSRLIFKMNGFKIHFGFWLIPFYGTIFMVIGFIITFIAEMPKNKKLIKLNSPFMNWFRGDKW